MSKFGNSIGGVGGSGEINSTSIGQSRASGGPVAGYSPSKGWGAGGAPAAEYGAQGHVAGTAAPTSQRASRPEKIEKAKP